MTVDDLQMLQLPKQIFQIIKSLAIYKVERISRVKDPGLRNYLLHGLKKALKNTQ